MIIYSLQEQVTYPSLKIYLKKDKKRLKVHGYFWITYYGQNFTSSHKLTQKQGRFYQKSKIFKKTYRRIRKLLFKITK